MFAALPPSSRVSRLPVPASARWISLPTSVDPVNAILSTPGWVTSAAPVVPAPVSTFTTPGGSPACWQTSASSSAVSGVVSAGLSTQVLPVGERGRQLPRGHQQREVPRDHLAGDAERARLRAQPGVLQLVRPARVVEEMRSGERDVDVAGFLDRLAVVEALQHRELAGSLLQWPGRSGTGTWPARRRASAPDPLVRARGRGDRAVDVGRARRRPPPPAAPRWPGSWWRSAARPRPGRTRRR